MDSSQESIISIIALLQEARATFSSSELVIRFNDIPGARERLDGLGMRYSINRLIVEIPVDAFSPIIFFWDIEAFFRGIAQIADPFNRVIFIYNQGQYLLWADESTRNESREQGYNSLFQVTKSYLLLRSFLIKLDTDTDKNQGFLEYYNAGSKKFLFSSHADTKRVTIPFPEHIPDFNFHTDISSSLNRFISAFESNSKHLPVFIKNEVISFLHPVNESERIVKLFEHLPRILDAAQLNFNVYLNNLSIDKIKQEYKEYKNRYFEQYSSLVSKVSTQIITLPITAIGSGIAIDRVTNSSVLAIIIVVLFIVSVFIAAVVQHYRGDLVFLKNSFQNDYTKIANSSFFVDHPDELNEFRGVRDSFNKKTDFLTTYLNIYYWVALLLNILLIGLIAVKIIVPSWVLFLGIGLFLVISIIHFRLVLRQD